MGSLEDAELLFLDTFSHDTSEDLNLDLVQFPKSVFVREIRIIPLGARVEGHFPGGVRLGATNPTKFHIDFFVNDLSKPGLSTFESLGSIDYCQNGQIHMECSHSEDQPQIPTDGLVLRGWYTTITLAVYGNLTKVKSEAPPVCANPPPPLKPVLPIEVTPLAHDTAPTNWNAEANPIPTYTSAAANPKPYGPPNYTENYENPIYRGEYYENEPPKDPRAYHLDNEWEKERVTLSCERERISPRTEQERDRRRRRSLSRSPRRRDRSRSREFIVKGEYRTQSRSRSRSRQRSRAMSDDRDWDRNSYKKEEYRRNREPSYERSRGGSYEKRSASYERRSPFDKRSTSYERKYEKRTSPYRGSSYEKQFRRGRGSSYGSRSPPRRPRTPPNDARVEFYHQSYRHKSCIRSPSQEQQQPFIAEDNTNNHSSLVNVTIVPTVPVEHSVASVEANVPRDIDSPGNIQEDEPEPFEPILSDEDICDDVNDNDDTNFAEVDYEVNDFEGVEDIIKYYNPFKSDWVRYDPVNKVHLLCFNKTDDRKDVMNATFDELCDVSTDLFRISEITKQAMGGEQKLLASTFMDIDNTSREEWVHQCEQIYVSLTNLCKETDIILRIFRKQNANEPEFSDIHDLLLTFCKIGLNFDYALTQQQPTYKIRHIKCGVRLAEALLSHKYNGEIFKILLDSGIDIAMLLLHMYSKEYMALSIRLMILKALNACLSSKESIQHFMKDRSFPSFDKSNKNPTVMNGYQALIAMMQTNPLSRLKFSISALIKKINIYELLEKFNIVVSAFNEKRESNSNERLSETDVSFIVDTLQTVLQMYRSQCFHMSQPKRFLPVSAQFEINKDCSNENLLEFFRIHRLLEACLLLLTCPTTCNNLVVVSPIHDLIYELIHSHNGLKFLYDNMHLCDLLFKSLLFSYGQQNAEEFVYPIDLTNYTDSQIVGLELAYRLKCMFYLDSISDLQAATKCQDDYELIDRLQSLYCLGFGSIGKIAVADVIIMGDNAECLMEVFDKSIKSKGKGESPKHKSPAKGYAIELIISAVRFSSNVPFLKKFGQRLLNVAREHDKFEQSVSSLLQEVIPYLKPIESSLLSGENMAECIEVLKANSEHAPDLPGELMTCLRILRHFCISDYDSNIGIASESSTDEYVELKYKYNVLQLFSLDGVAHLTGILDRLVSHFDQPILHCSLFASVRGLQLAQMLIPCLRLLDEMLARIVRARGPKFRDTTAIAVILKTYGLAKAFPVGCIGFRSAAKAAEASVRALLAYTQPIADDAVDNESIRRGPWTSLCAEVISYTMTAPYTFVSGLSVFSELLPLPLPMRTKAEPTEREMGDALNERRMWAAHLYPLSSEVTDMIRVICTSSYRPVVHMLRRVCVQMADLAANAAETVAAAASGALAAELKEGAPATGCGARLLGVIACLATHAPLKAAFLLHLGDLPKALQSVLTLDHSSNEHRAAQEYAAMTLAALTDAQVTLIPNDVCVANCLPDASTLSLLLCAVADCLSSVKACSVVAAILRAYFVLTEHEFGFGVFTKVAHQKREHFGKFFSWLIEAANEERAECLGLFLDLVRVLRMEEGEGPLARSTLLTLDQMADLVQYDVNDEEHPAIHLEKTLKERGLDEEAVSNARFVSSHLQRLKEEAQTPPPEKEELISLSAETLIGQFSKRIVHSSGEANDERLTASYWLNVPNGNDDEVHDGDLVPCDVSELARSLSGGAESLLICLRRAGGLTLPLALDNDHRPTPALCLSVARAREGDSFRSRPPNTSRPPSLHVDDFTAIHHNYGQNNRGMRRGGGSDRGRFASATPHHPHYRTPGRGAWEMGSHFGHFPPSSQYMMGGLGWGGTRPQRGPRHRNFIR